VSGQSACQPKSCRSALLNQEYRSQETRTRSPSTPVALVPTPYTALLGAYRWCGCGIPERRAGACSYTVLHRVSVAVCETHARTTLLLPLLELGDTAKQGCDGCPKQACPETAPAPLCNTLKALSSIYFSSLSPGCLGTFSPYSSEAKSPMSSSQWLVLLGTQLYWQSNQCARWFAAPLPPLLQTNLDLLRKSSVDVMSACSASQWKLLIFCKQIQILLNKAWNCSAVQLSATWRQSALAARVCRDCTPGAIQTHFWSALQPAAVPRCPDKNREALRRPKLRCGNSGQRPQPRTEPCRVGAPELAAQQPSARAAVARGEGRREGGRRCLCPAAAAPVTCVSTREETRRGNTQASVDSFFSLTAKLSDRDNSTSQAPFLSCPGLHKLLKFHKITDSKGTQMPTRSRPVFLLKTSIFRGRCSKTRYSALQMSHAAYTPGIQLII